MWPKTFIKWIENSTLHISIVFTWDLPVVRSFLKQRSFFWDKAVVGGTAIELIPDFFSDMPWVSIGNKINGILQRINPKATRTTTGCVNYCPWCAVPRIEGKLTELIDWPDLPVLIDNNLLAASIEHFDRVIDRLIVHGWADFNQGLDARLLNDYHAIRIAEINQPMVRLALDSMSIADQWDCAYDRLRSAGIAKKNICSYALIGFDSGPDEAWKRCLWIEGYGIKAFPSWFHRLDSMDKNIVTERQAKLGWNDYERRKIMQWFYQHKRAVVT